MKRGISFGEYNAKGKLLEETVYLDDMPVAVIKPTGVCFVHSDYRNVPRRIDNAERQVAVAHNPLVISS